MKKQYIIPNMTIVMVGATVLNSTSETLPMSGNTTTEVHSRGFFDFDDDEEE
jgi:hypothetical protein